MSRPTNEQLPELLIEAARALLVERGDATFSVRELCQRVGYSLTAVYRCFENRAAVLRQLQLTLFTEFNAYCVPSSADGPLDAVRLAGRRFVSWAVAHPSEYLFMFSDYRVESRLFDQRDVDAARSGLQGITFLLTAANAAGEIHIEHPEVVAIQLLSHLHGFVTLSLTGRLQGTPGADTEAFIAEHADTFVHRLLGLPATQ